MENELKEFIAEGSRRYKEASRLMVLFGKTVEKELQDILIRRKKWGSFKPNDIKKTKSTKFWSEYPVINAEILGTIHDVQRWIRIFINWTLPGTDIPSYSIEFMYDEIGPILTEKFVSYSQNSKFEIQDKRLSFIPDPKNFDLDRDFNLLIDEFVNIIDS